MSFRAGLKNSGKWFRVNKTIRENDALKNAINTDDEIHNTLEQMDLILNAERTAAGIPDSEFSEDIAAQGFPLPLRLWQGRLVYSYREAGATGATANQKLFSQHASDLRKRVDEIFRAYSMLSDAYEKPGDTHPNPGGVVSEEPAGP